jgi:hypothetical protein
MQSSHRLERGAMVELGKVGEGSAHPNGATLVKEGVMTASTVMVAVLRRF